MLARAGLASSFFALFTVIACRTTDDAVSGGDALTNETPSARPLDPRSPWPKFRRNLEQDGRSPVTPAVSSARPWSFRTKKGIFSTAVIDGDENIYIGSADKTFYAFDRTGNVRWSAPTGEIIDSSALLDDHGRVYFGSGDGHLRALDTQTGHEVWNFTAADPATTGGYINWFEGNVAMGPDGTLYVPNDNHHVYGLDRDTSASKPGWPFTMNDQTWSLPAIDAASGRLYIGNNFMFAENELAIGADGTQVWGASVQGTVAASPMLADGKMVVGAFDGYVRAYDANDGTLLWSFATNDHIYASPARLSDGTILQPSADGTLYALDPANGALRWQFDTREPIRSSPAVDGNDNVYFGGGDGRLYVLDGHGKLRFSRKLIESDRNDFGGSPALGHELVVIAGESGEIFATPYDWCLRPEARGDASCTLGAPALADGTFLYFTTPLGSVLTTPPDHIEPNQALAFSLVRRASGATKLALLDEPTLSVTVDPPAAVDIQTSADRRFFTVVPKARFAGSRVHLKVHGQYLVDPDRNGLVFSGGRPGGPIDAEFDFALGDAAAQPWPLAVPHAPGDPSGTLEIARIAVPYPTVLPSYNQIGFDSLHYLAGMVEGSGTTSIGWIVGGLLAPNGETIVDPATQALFPVETTYEGGDLTFANESGFTVHVMNFDMPFDIFRISAHFGEDGMPRSQPSVHVETKCGRIPFYGTFLAMLGFCSPTTDVMNVFGSTEMRPYRGGVSLAPQGTGNVVFQREGSDIVAAVSGGALKLAEHAFGVLLVDATTNKALSLKYGLPATTSRTANQDGSIATVRVTLPPEIGRVPLRAHLMVDTYPAATGTVN